MSEQDQASDPQARHCPAPSRLSAYHDGELPPEARSAVERHVRECPQCLTELERLRELSRQVATVARLEMPAAARRRLHEAVDRLGSASIFRVWRLLPEVTMQRIAGAMAAAAAAVLIFCLVGLSRQEASAASAAEGMQLWEDTTVGQTAEVTAGPEEGLARWMVDDLSGRPEQ
jgi:anti-sigma factor RsiW